MDKQEMKDLLTVRDRLKRTKARIIQRCIPEISLLRDARRKDLSYWMYRIGELRDDVNLIQGILEDILDGKIKDIERRICGDEKEV
jgi:hypothetical protein